MDWNKFISENASALIGLAGVCIGALLAAIPTFFITKVQRKWQLADQYREWRMQRLLSRISPIEEWVDEILYILRLFDAVADEGVRKTDFWNGTYKELQKRFMAHEMKDATVLSQIGALDDQELVKLCTAMRKKRGGFLEALQKGNREEINNARVTLDATAAKIRKNIEDLLEAKFIDLRK